MRPSLKPDDVRHIVVHCSATKPSQNLGAADIDRMHRMRGFRKIGYHYVIRRDGSIETGRTLAEVGAHAEGHNTSSVSVCLIGGVNDRLKPEANYTELQLATLGTILGTLQDLFPGAKVVGHRDLPGVAKACPSFDVGHWLATGQVRA